MYCSSCGAAVVSGLVYCNQCGERLRGGKGGSSELAPQSLIWAMVATFVFGMIPIVAAVTMMRRFDIDVGIVYTFLGFSFTTLLLLESVFIWLLVGRGISRKAEREDFGSIETNRLREQPAREFYVAPSAAPARDSLIEPVPSVVEQTTNQLQPVYRGDQKLK